MTIRTLPAVILGRLHLRAFRALANCWRALVMARDLRSRHDLSAIRPIGEETGVQEHSAAASAASAMSAWFAPEPRPATATRRIRGW